MKQKIKSASSFPYRFLLLACISLVLGSCLHAQSKDEARLDAGVAAFEQGEYAEALKSLEAVLVNADQLSSPIQAKAYYFHGKALLKRFGNAALEGDSLFRRAHPDVPLEAHRDFQKAKSLDTEGNWADKIARVQDQLSQSFRVGALQRMELSNNPDLSAATRREVQRSSLPYWQAAIEISPEDYFPYNLRGRVYLELADTANAKADFMKGITLFEGRNQDNPELKFGSMYYLLGIFEWTEGEARKALELLQRGEKQMLIYYEKRRKLKEEIDQTEYAQGIMDYFQFQANLRRFREDIFKEHPEMLATSLLRLQKEAEAQPTETFAQIAYARILEFQKSGEAADQYRKALKINPDSQPAWIGLGESLLQKGKALEAAAKTEGSKANASKMRSQAFKVLQEARSALEKSWELDKSGPAAQGLMEIAGLTQDFEEERKWSRESRDWEVK